MKGFFLIIFLLLAECVFATEYFVSTYGNNSNSGRSESEAWKTISHAANKVKAGDTVWIKAGNYGNETVVIKSSGNKSSLISFIGYKNTKGDIKSMYFTYIKGKKLDASEMPLLDGGQGGINQGFTVRGDYILVKNIQITNYSSLMYVTNSPTGVIIDNVLAHTAGRTTNQPGEQGKGILFNSDKGHHNIIRNCVAVNCSVANFRIYGDNNLIENCKSYADRNDLKRGEATDYYIVTRGSNNIIRGCYVERVGNLSHNGHGISLKAVGIKTENNIVENNTIVNVKGAIEARHSQVRNNVFRNNTILGWKSSSENGGIVISDGASHNIFENSKITGTNEAFRWYESSEDGGSGKQGSNNIFRNIIVDNVHQLVYSGKYDAEPIGNISNNQFLNCTFNNIKEVVGGWYKFDSTNKIQNCIFNDVSRYENKHIRISPEWTEINNNYFGEKEINRKGDGNMNVNPKFRNKLKGDFNLDEDSELIDKGKVLDNVKTDFNGNSRPKGKSHDIGAFEYQDGKVSSVNANAGEDVTICEGEEVTLTASGGSSYLWANGKTTKSIIARPSSITTYSVTVTEGGVSDTDEVVVRVNKVEAHAGEDVTIEAGKSVTLSASGGDSYEWSTGETTKSIIVSPSSSKTYSVIVKKNGCKSTDEVKVTVKTETISPVIANAGEDVTICNGEEVTLTASGGSSYLWANGKTTQSIIARPSSTKTYSVIVTEGSVSDTDEVIVRVNKVEADAGEDVDIEAGESVTLTASGGDLYEWSTGETAKSITVSPLISKTYKVAAIKGDCTSTDEVTVNVKITVVPEVIADAGEDLTICLGESVTLTASGGNTYLWNNNSTEKEIVVSPSRTTTYTVIVSDNGVEATDEVKILVENCAKEEEDELTSLQTDIKIYPNPSAGTLYFSGDKIDSDLDLHLINVNGKVIYQNVIKSGQNSLNRELNLNHVTSGIYFVKLSNSYSNYVKKIVII